MDNKMSIPDIIEKYAKELNFADWSYAKADSLDEYKEYFLQRYNTNMFAEMEYLKRNIDKRFDPELLVEGCKTIITFLIPYGKNSRIDAPVELLIDNHTTKEYKVSQYAIGGDYHSVIKNKLFTILEKIRDFYPDTNGRVFTDTAPIYERGWGAICGLGFIGKNNFLISRKAGIRNFIGIIIIDKELIDYPEKKQMSSYCGNCTKCIDACPTGALNEPYSLDAGKCISYITIEKKGANINDNITNAPSNNFNIFGCDACMNACPWNTKNIEGWQEFEPQNIPININHFKRR